MTDAATFLAQVVPWPTPAAPGFVNIHSPFLRPGTIKPVWPGHAFEDLNGALGNVDWRVRKANDVYVCMSLQQDAHPAKPGKRNRGAMRAAARAVLIRSFWIDADTKLFKDDLDLLTQFGTMRRAVGLPAPSFVVSSGGGYHFYWVLPEPIPHDRWQPIADALAEACRRHKFDADHQCTVNPAQLMRIPGTVNYKYTPPRDAKIIHSAALVLLSELEGPLAAYKTAYRRPVTLGTPTQRLSLPSLSKPSKVFAGMVLGPPLTEGVELEWKPTAAEVAVECPWFSEQIATGGAGNGPRVRDPQWFEALKVAYHCKDPVTTAHAVSKDHDGYSPAATDEKFRTASASAEQYGWPQCTTIQRSGSTHCASCTHLIHNKSPINFVLDVRGPPVLPPQPVQPIPNVGNSPPLPTSGNTAPPGPAPGPIPGTSQTGPVIPFMPSGYRYDRAGLIEHMVKTEDRKSTEWLPMYPVRVNGFVRQKINKELKFGREMLYFQYEDDDGYRDVQVKLKEVQDLRALRAALSEQGMVFKDSEAQHMGRFMVSFIQQLRAAPHLSIECEPYGWAMKGGVEDAFTYDGTRFNCNGNRQVMPTDTKLGEKFKATGDLAIWKAAAKLVTDQKRPELDALIAASLGAPLVQMTGHNGFVISGYSTHTGVQKSAAMKVGQAIWGDPVGAMSGLDDTNNFLNTRLGMLRHLPLFVDELKFAEDFRKAEVLVLGITQGKTKGKLTRDSQTMETLTFNTMMIAAGNASLVEHIAEHAKTTTAGMARIFEYIVPPHRGIGIVDSGRAQALIGQLAQNYGTAGRVYAEFLGQNVPVVRNDVLNMITTINGIVNGQPEERFWVASIAVLIVGAKYGNELGLTEIDLNQLSLFLLEQFKVQRRGSEVSPSNVGAVNVVERYVTDFVNSHRQQTLLTDIVELLPGRNATKATVLNDATSIMGMSRGISIHAVRDQKIVRISLGDFGKWLAKEHKVSRHIIVKSVKELLLASETKVSLGRGTIYKRAPELVLEFDVNLVSSLNLFS